MPESSVEKLFAAAVRLRPGPERFAFLNTAVGEDRNLLAAVEKLLALHDDAGSFLELNALERDPSLQLVSSTDRSDAERLEDVFQFLNPDGFGESLGSNGRFKLLQLLGMGANATVLLAEDQLLRREVAIKLLSPGVHSSASQKAELLKEARTAAALDDEHVVQVFDMGEHLGTPYLVMEYFSEGSLQTHLERSGPVSGDECRVILLQVTAALEAAHFKKIIHRDVKPSNVFVERFPDRIKLGDFGLAVPLDSTTSIGAAAGTYQYTAPEQLAGECPNPKADLFSLGCLGVALLTGRSPFAGSVLNKRPQRLPVEIGQLLNPLGPELPSDMKELLICLLADDPDERPASASVVREKLAGD